MIDSLFEAMGFKRVATVKDNIIYPVEFQCDICGDCHDKDRVPFGCQTGDGE